MATDLDVNKNLKCVFCGRPAEIQGRWSNARVVCRSCGMESRIDEYKDQIEDWLHSVC